MENSATRLIELSWRSARLAAAHVCQYVVMTTSTATRTSATYVRRTICRFIVGCVRPVRDEEEKREQDEVRDDARAAVGDERKRDPGQRDDAQHAADDDERLQREAEGQPCGQQLREAVVRLQRDAHPPDDEEHEHEEERRSSDEPELLGDRREDEVRAQVGDQLGAVDRRERALAEPGAAEPAVGDRVEALHELVRRAVLAELELAVERAVDRSVRPGLQPDRDAVLDVADRVVEHRRTAEEEPEPGCDEQRASGRDVEHREEDPEVQERASEVVGDDDDEHRGAPDREQRPEVLELPLRERPHASRAGSPRGRG